MEKINLNNNELITADLSLVGVQNEGDTPITPEVIFPSDGNVAVAGLLTNPSVLEHPALTFDHIDTGDTDIGEARNTRSLTCNDNEGVIILDEDEEDDIPLRNRKVLGKSGRPIVDDMDDSSPEGEALGLNTPQAMDTCSLHSKVDIVMPIEEDKKRHSPTLQEPLTKRLRRKRQIGEIGNTDGQNELPKFSTNDIEKMSAAVLGARTAKLLALVEELRYKCKNMNGSISGQMKGALASCQLTVQALTIRAEKNGDQAYLRMRNSEMSLRIKQLEKENQRLKQKARGSASSGSLNVKSVSPGLNSVEPSELAESIVVSPDVGYIFTDCNQVVQREKNGKIIHMSNKEDLPLPMRPPIKGVSKPIPDTVDRVTEEDFSRQISALIAARKEFRDRKKMDMKNGRNYVRDGDGRKDEMTEGIQKNGVEKGQRSKGGPRIVEDIMITPAYSDRNPALVDGKLENWSQVVRKRKDRQRTDVENGAANYGEERIIHPFPRPIDTRKNVVQCVRIRWCAEDPQKLQLLP